MKSLSEPGICAVDTYARVASVAGSMSSGLRECFVQSASERGQACIAGLTPFMDLQDIEAANPEFTIRGVGLGATKPLPELGLG